MPKHAVCVWLVVPMLVGSAAAAQTPEEETSATSEMSLTLASEGTEPCSGPSSGLLLMASLSSLPAVSNADSQAALQPRPMAFEYSDGYRIRNKIHKYASFATLPLFVSQYLVGQKLYDGSASDNTRSAHNALAASTGVLFAANSITGVWNLREGRKDPNHRKRRFLHGMLMLAADAGFVATGMLAPDDEGEGGTSRSTHRTVALTSMGVATVSYLIMLFGH